MCRVCLILLVTWLCRGTRICRACSLCLPRFQTTLPSRRCFVLQVSNQALHPTPCTAHAMTATILVTVPLPLLPQHASTATPTTVWRLRRRLSPPATGRRLTLKVRCTAECGADRATVGARARVVGMPRRVPPPEAVYVSLWPRECPGLLNTDGGCATDHHGSEANAGVCTSQNASPWYRGGRDAHLTNQYVPPRRDNRLLWGFTLACGAATVTATITTKTGRRVGSSLTAEDLDPSVLRLGSQIMLKSAAMGGSAGFLAVNEVGQAEATGSGLARPSEVLTVVSPNVTSLMRDMDDTGPVLVGDHVCHRGLLRWLLRPRRVVLLLLLTSPPRTGAGSIALRITEQVPVCRRGHWDACVQDHARSLGNCGGIQRDPIRRRRSGKQQRRLRSHQRTRVPALQDWHVHPVGGAYSTALGGVPL